MKIEFEATDLAFRDEVRRFFEDEYPREVIAKIENGQTLSRADHILSQTALNKRGWLGVGWPAQFGGTGWTPIQRYLFDEELERRGAPNIIPMAVIYIGPIICAFGSPDQQDRWLPDILESRSLWAQGYSEPEAGSDLASLSFDARRDGDDYILNGTKIWTSGAHMADWIFLLARTSREGRKQDGISLICAELDLPGVSVRPIISIDGLHELNQVSFDNVRVPVSHRIGDEGRAWRYSNVLLKNERLSYAHIGRKKRDLETARKLAGDDRNLRHRIARAEIELGAIEVSVQRADTWSQPRRRCIAEDPVHGNGAGNHRDIPDDLGRLCGSVFRPHPRQLVWGDAGDHAMGRARGGRLFFRACPNDLRRHH